MAFIILFIIKITAIGFIKIEITKILNGQHSLFLNIDSNMIYQCNHMTSVGAKISLIAFSDTISY